jgi:hypothetical protein
MSPATFEGGSPPAWVSGLTALALGLVALQALYAVPALAWEWVRGDDALAVITGLAAAVVFLGLAGRWRQPLVASMQALADRAARVPPRRWLLIVLAIGIGLRVAWAMVFPARPTSDGATYLALAQRLVAGEPYEASGTRAYWPPGYPFFLVGWLAVPGLGRHAVLASNLALFAGSLIVVSALARRVAGEPGVRIATLLLAVWPNLVAMAGLPEKEQLVVLLLPLTILLFASGGGGWTLLAGITLGFATLVQPSVQLFVTVLVIHELARWAPLRQAAGRLVLVIVGMALVIAPWSIRNYQVFGQPVLLATNGGSVLYRANNPQATGAYTARGERSLEGYGELEANRLGYEWAREWIAENPAIFARLALRKQVLFLGDDSVGVYQSLRRGLATSETIYAAGKGVANAFWLGLWVLLLIALLQRRAAPFVAPLSITLVFGFLYFYGIHSIFESTGKYHVPALAMLAIVAGALLGTAALRAPAGRPESPLPVTLRPGITPHAP